MGGHLFFDDAEAIPIENPMMNLILKQGRLIFAVAIVALGIENLVCAHSTQHVMPFVPEVPMLAYLTGLAFLTAGVAIAINKSARLAAILLGILFLLCVLVIEVSNVAAHPADVGIRTVAFETLTFCGISWMLAGTLPAERFRSPQWESAETALIKAGRYLFAISAIVFGIDHFLVIPVIVSLVPGWIPGSGLFWTYLTAIAFIAAGISLAANVLARWAGFMLGVMFMLWVLVLHGPRVVSYPRSHNPDEWSSALIALAIWGGSWIAACAPSKEAPSKASVPGPRAVESARISSLR
jgi:uncharacterized membrane protein YphA (DoxX/SURF4 family)